MLAMSLTLGGFARRYVAELTGTQTTSLRKLLALVLSDAPTAAEAVMVFAGTQGKQGYLSRLARGSALEADYAAVASAMDELGTEAFLQSADAPERYKKVWRAYVAERDAILTDRRVIGLMRAKTLDSLRESGMTVYRLCKDLGLNEGNVYAYLNAGDVTKVSRATARRILEHAR